MDSWSDLFINAWNRHDVDAIAGFMTDDAEYIHSGGSQRTVLRGIGEIRQWVAALNEGWSSDYVLEATFAVLADDAFAIEYTERGTADLGTDPPGRSFNLHSAFVGELRNGKVSRITDYADMLAYTQQMHDAPADEGGSTET